MSIYTKYTLNKVNKGGSLALKNVRNLYYYMHFLVVTLITKMCTDISDMVHVLFF